MDHVEVSPTYHNPSRPLQELPLLQPREQELLAAVRRKRLELARQEEVPAFWILTNTTLRHLAVLRPATPEAMLAVPGIGPVKLQKYGLALLETLSGEALRLGLPLNETLPPRGRSMAELTGAGGRLPPRWREKAREAFRGGATLHEVSLENDIKPSAALEELLAVVRESGATSLAPWVSDAQLQQVRTAGAALGWELLAPLREYLQGEMPYPLLRLCRDFLRGPDGGHGQVEA